MTIHPPAVRTRTTLQDSCAATAVVTGGTDGIGKEIAYGLAITGHDVVIIGRDVAKGQASAEQIRRAVSTGQVHFVRADLSLVREVDRLVADLLARFPSIRLLIHSAGVVLGERQLTDEGNERMFAVNYLGRFALTQALLPAMARASYPDSPSHVFFVSGAARGGRIHYADPTLRRGFGLVAAVRQFCQANDLFAVELDDQIRRAPTMPRITVTCLKLGVVKTGIRGGFPPWMKWIVRAVLDPLIGQTPQQAAATVRKLIAEPRAPDASPLYSSIRRLKPLTLDGPLADPVERARFVAWSTQLVEQTRRAQMVAS